MPLLEKLLTISLLFMISTNLRDPDVNTTPFPIWVKKKKKSSIAQLQTLSSIVSWTLLSTWLDPVTFQSMSLSTSYSSLLSINSQLEHNQKLKTNHKLRWLRSTSSQHTTTIFLNNQRCASLKTNAIADSLILGATSPAKSGDIREFLITRLVSFFLSSKF